jgi:oxalate decarboxylase/phosphoglucose isomerase-like protein (cupin superfamily)
MLRLSLFSVSKLSSEILVSGLLLHPVFCMISKMASLIRTCTAFVSTFCFLATTCRAMDIAKNPEIVARLKTANTYLDRMNLFPNNADWVYDFAKNPLYSWNPGSVCNANTATFPVLTGLGMTLAMLNLGPCSILPPHLHPRATNLVVAISGSSNTFMLQENGARTITTNLTPGKMTVFPRGSLHTMQNMG